MFMIISVSCHCISFTMLDTRFNLPLAYWKLFSQIAELDKMPGEVP